MLGIGPNPKSPIEYLINKKYIIIKKNNLKIIIYNLIKNNFIKTIINDILK